MDLLKEKSKVILNCNRVLNFLYDKKGVEFFELNVNEIDFRSWLRCPPDPDDPTGEKGFAAWINYVKRDVTFDALRILSTFDLIYMTHAAVMIHRDSENPEYSYPYVKILVGIKCIVPPKPHLMCQRLVDRFQYGENMGNSTELFGTARYLSSYEEIKDVWHNMLLNSATKSDKDHVFFIFNKSNNEEDFWWCPLIESVFALLSPSARYEAFENAYAKWDSKYDVEGLNFRSSPSKEAILLNLVKIFMEFRGLFVEDGWIYQLKADKSESRVIKLENFFDFSKVLVISLRHAFPHQINEEDLNLLMFEVAGECLKRVLAVPSLLPQRPNKYKKLYASISKIREDDFLVERRGESDF